MKPAYTTERLFKPKAPGPVYRLAQKIEWGDDIRDSDVAPVKEFVNARYDEEITLLFLALDAQNLSAIDKLLQFGADPYAIAQPSKKNASFSFASALGSTNYAFLTPCIRLYLKHGGNPNYRAPDAYQRPLIKKVALSENYEGFWLLINAGADPWANANMPDGKPDNAMMSLAFSWIAYDHINKLIDLGYFNKVDERNLASFMMALSGYEQRNDEISRSIQQVAKRILKLSPNYPDDVFVKRIFGDPVPTGVRQ